jgi:RNA polymerase sigma-70 factor (ECF subfamily)
VSNGQTQTRIERAEVESLYRRYGPAVFRRAHALLGREADAHDAVQDVFVRVLHSYGQFRHESSPMTWLYRVTTNLCLNRMRDTRRRAELLRQQDPEQTVAGVRLELSPDVRDLLRSVPEEVAAAAVYHHVDGMTHEEIAGLLGVSRRTVGNLLERFQRSAGKRLAGRGETRP